MKPRMVLMVSALLFVLVPGVAVGHKPSDSYLRLKVDNLTVQGQWDISLRDLDYVIGIDGNDDGQITWGELRAHHQTIATYALSRLHMSGDGAPCWIHPTGHLVDNHSDGAYAVLRFSATCPAIVNSLNLNYQLFFDVDRLHRGLMHLEHRGLTQTAVFSPGQPIVHLDLTTPSPWREFLQFGREGVWHIWIGYDHILFLISLLLPAVLWWGEGGWRAVPSFKPAFWNVCKIITAFTLAHSITLSLAVLGMVNLPSRWVESVIAASVLLVALHNLYPVIQARLWIVTFGFGLIHGLGFASVLLDLDVPGTSLFVALGGFNLGVEMGQIAIVGLLFPLSFLLRRTWSYQHLILRYGSVFIALVASIWLLERSLNLQIGMEIW